MRILSVVAAIACCLLLSPSASFAQLGPKGPRPAPAPAPNPGAAQTGGVVTKVTAEQLAAAITAAGFRAQVTTNKNVKFVETQMRNNRVVATLANCDQQGCGNFSFTVWFNDKVQLDFVNAWNNQWRFAKLAIDSDGDLAFSQDVMVSGGITTENIKENAKAFDLLLNELTNFNP